MNDAIADPPGPSRTRSSLSWLPAWSVAPLLPACFLLGLTAPARLAIAQSINTDVLLRQALVIGTEGRAARTAVRVDTVEAQVVAGQWRAPVAGEKLRLADGRERTWTLAEVNKEGWLAGRGMGGGYVYWPIESVGEQVMILEAAGHNCAYVNGEIRTGDPYAYGYVRLPVRLRPGTNEFLFQCSRGRFRARLSRPTAPLLVNTSDLTLPDLIAGETAPVWGSVVIINASTDFMSVSLRTKGRKSAEHTVIVPPLGVSKAPFLYYPSRVGQSAGCPVRIEATGETRGGRIRAEATVTLRVRRLDQVYKRTFLSSIDGSVQYYAVNPACAAAPGVGTAAAPALFLSLHGASVEALGQAEAYSPKPWGHIVCPTNRRPYGFDWEEWGRWDALEVLGLAQASLHCDPARVYLTGHSMGGHGSWQLGAIYPDHFAAVGPSAGWISFLSYAEATPAPVTNAVHLMLRRAAAASDTLLMATNYLQEGVYVLHGDADDNVPVSEARHMRAVLAGFHRDFDFHEQHGAGHWWDASDEPGADCVDWAPMFDFFAHHTLPADESVRRVRFVTVNPAVSARAHWVTVLAQQHPLEPSVVDIRCDPGKRRLVGTTTNVASICLNLPAIPPGPALTIDLDGQKLQNIPYPSLDSSSEPAALGVADVPFICLERRDGRWQRGALPPPSMKNPLRSGPFRQAFYHHVAFVYGTRGTPEENAWALAKARYDAETFWYRGNGSVDLIADSAFIREAGAGNTRSRSSRSQTEGAGRNVILYGNADMNAAWVLLLASSPVQVHRGAVQVGGRQFTGDNLACLFLEPNPNPGDETALVGVVAGSGLPGLRLTDRMPYFLSGAGFPDCLVATPDLLTKGPAGLRAAGFFGPDWRVESGEFAYQ